MSGLDIEPGFFDLGYELFRDREKMHATFLAADLTKTSGPRIAPLQFKILSVPRVFSIYSNKRSKDDD